MPANAVVRARIDERIKEEAAAILEASGLTVSDAFRMMLVRTVADKALPFDPLVPNEETVEAMKEARAGKLRRVSSVAGLLDELNAGD
ncbi:type II toxin-antitoxin system RelB/DinJ family antitoxin [Aquamicrobium sp. LC103]|uniref:type II toxin-antitoxin system RelB/DinJ family antitoxin n=1 Tax=Aquamicrobium sp. LC103 TaxID=1120658 RepID=UPI00063E77DC|nr:type II toxin-antitoxin system RelB/DinJ family antitoxin [Aquamicrobium sp. LC103]TKT79363.1 type II toxin-antitoxin system RelB/DinJ family antitoxin [Aquamicrobium sp. LC103]